MNDGLAFVKVEGAGNDYVLVDATTQDVPHPGALSVAVSDRHRGVGSDGLLLLEDGGEDFAASMRIFNADGSEGRMCGNGLRCVVRYLVEQGRAPAESVPVWTAAGPRSGRLLTKNEVEIGMGVPSFDPAEVPVDARPGPDGLVALPVSEAWRADPEVAFAVSVGNPHLVVRQRDPAAVDAFDLAEHGARLGDDPRLTEGANVHAVAEVGSDHLHVRPFERGSGLTRACGTGAVAVAVVAACLGWVEGDTFRVDMPGGSLGVRWSGSGEAFLRGPAQLAFQGVWPLS